MRAALAAFGDSLLVVGEPELLRVHVHTDDPGGALSCATALGRVRRVKVEDMQAQHEAFAAEAAPPAAAADAGGDAAGAAALPIGVVAAAAGAGFAGIYASLGARVVPGGQTMNPSTEQFLRAIEACPQGTVIVLPNNRNVVPTARQAAALAAKEVHVVPTETMAQGIGALLAVRYDEDPARIAAAMGEAAARVRTAELTTAVRDAEVGGLRVRRGDILGLLDGTLVAAGADAASVAGDLLERMPATAYEIATIYRGEGAAAADAAALAALIRRRYPELALEELEGGQPHYQFVLSLE